MACSSPACLLLLLASVALYVANTRAQGVVFERTSSTDTCTLDTGDEGRCLDIRSCPPVRQTIREKRPVVCGFNGTFPVVCCPAPVDLVSTPLEVTTPKVVTTPLEVTTPKVVTTPLVVTTPKVVTTPLVVTTPKVVTTPLVVTTPKDVTTPLVVTEPRLNFSPPQLDFVCGLSSTRSIPTSPLLGDSFRLGDILRPGHNLTRLVPGLLPQGLRPGGLQPGRLVPGLVPGGFVPGGIAPNRRFQKRSSIPINAIEAHPETFTERNPVIGGKTSVVNAWPWMALLGVKNADDSIDWYCAGALINKQWVLTAYHCFQYVDINLVRLGEHDYNEEGEANHQEFNVVETVLYPGFTFPAAYHDLALLKLDREVKIQSYIRPACLPWGEETKTRLVDQQVTLTGWGNTQFGGSPSSVLQQVDVTVFSSSDCDRSYSELPDYSSAWPQGIGEEILCAGDKKGGRDACQGDSGGPVVSKNSAGRYIVAGIVSRGYGCGHRRYPGLYVNLRHPPYLSWIKRVAFQ